MKPVFKLGEREVGRDRPVFCVAEIGSNFDGDLDRAFRLIDLAVASGADGVKFQTFLPDKIINRRAFDGLKTGFQAAWDKDVYTVYQEASLPREWHQELARRCRRAGTVFMSSPYDFSGVDLLVELGVPAIKIGSGDLNWPAMLRHVAARNLPVILATGACTLSEVDLAVRTLEAAGCDELILLQCVTNYPSRFESANIRAMANLGRIFDVPCGYSDHTPGWTVPLGAVALGGCLIEKHFTDDRTRPGPDHPHAMEAQEFGMMVRAIRDLEAALGDGVKRVAAEEHGTRILQRRSLYAARDLRAGQTLTPEDVVVLRPQHGILPQYYDQVIGRTLVKAAPALTSITWEHF